jgi:hypothetical protein
MEKVKKRTESKNQKKNEKTTFIVLTKQESEVAV